jgi:hypothetical protein
MLFSLCLSVFPILGIEAVVKLFHFEIRSEAEKNMLNILLLGKFFTFMPVPGEG